MFTRAETDWCCRLVELAREEDLEPAGDLTSLAVIPAGMEGQAAFVARAKGIVAGLPAAQIAVAAIDCRLQFQPVADIADGKLVQPGQPLANVAGPMSGILAAERMALNFLQHLSGIASLTRQYVDAIAGLPAQILDTRKTTPGWRLLEKYAVRQGGGHNHRFGLFDGILIKDNHLEALGIGREGIAQAVAAARDKVGESVPVEIEVDSLDQLDRALNCSPDIVLLDNMPPDLLREAVRRRNAAAPSILLEASGGITLETVRDIARTGVDRISVGALTHSAPALDIALDYRTMPKGKRQRTKRKT
ncbi:MAG TPA: carboxylating nicotinate-nucleotide diphosphorylase [Gemmataceae bacterium]|nr:carboxylating nicotinate-nucleotide diphosphorylase [Gemmataceae bacterium]